MGNSNRKIAFRVWDRKEKIMLDWDFVMEYEMTTVFDHDDFIPMQFTGLLDKNGKEIYEGDIVEREVDNDGFIPEKIKVRKEVKFFEGAFFTHKEYTVRENYLPIVAVWGEVIGNIYQNPELIKND